jgi:DNA-directed RNA polymerase specialized sigma24 family protein
MYACCTFTHDVFRYAFPRLDQRLAWFHDNYGGDLRQYLKKVANGYLGWHDLEDAYQETLYAFLKVLGREDVPPDQYFAVLCGIGQRKVRHIRRRLRDQPTTNVEDVLEFLRDDDHLPPMGWLPEEIEEFHLLLESEIAQLPSAQWEVAQLYLAHIQEFGARNIYERLAQLSAETGHPRSVHTIKNLWHTAKATFSAGLLRRYHVQPGELP